MGEIDGPMGVRKRSSAPTSTRIRPYARLPTPADRGPRFVNSAYRSAEAEEKLAARSFRSRICVHGTRGHPLSKAKAAANRAKSRIRSGYDVSYKRCLIGDDADDPDGDVSPCKKQQPRRDLKRLAFIDETSNWLTAFTT